MATRGTLYLVVGPSGAGKDSLIAAARAAFANDPRYLVPRRLITRPAEAGGEDYEDYIELSPAAFEIACAEGVFSLYWKSHSLAYGIPKCIEESLAAGRSVVVNVSRAAVEDARKRLQPVKVILVTAPIPMLAERLAKRGRESVAELAERLQRAGYAAPTGPDVVTIDNSGKLEEAVHAFLAALRTPPLAQADTRT